MAVLVTSWVTFAIWRPTSVLLKSFSFVGNFLTAHFLINLEKQNLYVFTRNVMVQNFSEICIF